MFAETLKRQMSHHLSRKFETHKLAAKIQIKIVFEVFSIRGLKKFNPKIREGV